MISWISGEIVDTWIKTKKIYVLINCQGLGYEVQVLEPLEKDLDKNMITLWIHQIKREDSDYFFGFKDKEKRDFFRDLLQVKGIGPQIGMTLLNKYDLNQIFKSVREKDKALFNITYFNCKSVFCILLVEIIVPNKTNIDPITKFIVICSPKI